MYSIKKINGFENLNLNHIDLEGNEIEKIEGLNNCINLRTLRISKNNIKKIENLNNLKVLIVLILNDNKIEKIEGLENLSLLKIIEGLYLDNKTKFKRIFIDKNPLKYSQYNNQDQMDLSFSELDKLYSIYLEKKERIDLKLKRRNKIIVNKKINNVINKINKIEEDETFKNILF